MRFAMVSLKGRSREDSVADSINRKISFTTAMLFIAIGTAVFFFSALPEVQQEVEIVPPPQPEWKERTINYSLTIRNTSSYLVQNSKVLIFSPVAKTSHQRVVELDASENFSELTDLYGNKVLSFSLSLPPYGTRVLSVAAKVQFTVIPEKLSLASREMYLVEEKYIEINSPLLDDIVKELEAQTSKVTPLVIQNWIIENIREIGYLKEDRGALYAAKERKGDCTEHSYLFIALARKVGIPARLIGGFVQADNKKIRADDYHNWVEFYNSGAWQIADPHGDSFMQNQSKYVAFRIIGEGEAQPMNSSERFIAFHPDLEISLD